MRAHAVVVDLAAHLELGPARVSLVGGVVRVHVLGVCLLHLGLSGLLLLSQLRVASVCVVHARVGQKLTRNVVVLAELTARVARVLRGKHAFVVLVDIVLDLGQRSVVRTLALTVAVFASWQLLLQVVGRSKVLVRINLVLGRRAKQALHVDLVGFAHSEFLFV